MNDITKWVVFDCEADGLHPKKFYCVSFEDHEGKKGTLSDYSEIREFFKRYEWYAGHNIRRWDLPELARVVQIEIPDLVIDTLAVAWYLEPDRGKHNLESFGTEFGIEKKVITSWSSQTQSEYEERCEIDVQINVLVFKKYLKKLQKIYSGTDLKRFLRYLDFKMFCAALQEKSRWKLDREAVLKSIEKLSKEREEKVHELESRMPKVPVVSTYQPPKRLYNADGQLSVLGHRWKERLDEGGYGPEHDGPIELITGYDEPNPQSTSQVKDWLLSLGWKPRTFKSVKNKKTGEVKEVPQVNLPNGGGICESVQLLYEKEPALESLENLGVISHRLGLLNGYLRDAVQLDDGYYLQACVAGLTNTLRFKHAEIVNLPKPDKPYGLDIRGPLIAPEGYELCGSDMASLEDRIKQHFLFPHDPDYVHELNKPDYDPHLDLALLAGAVTPEQVQAYKDKIPEVLKEVKPIRSIYKNGNYACQYGAGIPRLMVTCDCDRATATKVHKAYWKRNWAIKAVSKEQKVQTIDGQTYLQNPVSKFWYVLRTEKDIFSTLVQGTAAYCFDTWLRFVLSKREQLTGQFHDEFILTVRKGHRDEVTSFLNETIQETNDYLNLNRELGISIEFGNTYADIH